MITRVGSSQRGSGMQALRRTPHRGSMLMPHPPRSDAVPILTRAGHSSSLLPGPAEQALEALPPGRDAVGTFGSCTASPLHRSWNLLVNPGSRMQQQLRQVLGQSSTSENLSDYWLCTLWGLDAAESLLCQKCWALNLRNIFPKEWRQSKRSQMTPRWPGGAYF